jgi:hypothetical protein
MASTFTFFIDPAYDFEERRLIARASVDYIVERTRDGRGIGGDKLGKYSKNYIRTTDFGIAKSGETDVNLTLTGDMLDSLQVLDVTIAGRIVIGYTEGNESDKAKWMQEKGYDFLGLEQDEIESILSNFEDPSASLNDIVRIFQVG